jgi:hypothetical protein
MWEPQRLTILWVSTACYSDSFTRSFCIYATSKEILFSAKVECVITDSKRMADYAVVGRLGEKDGQESIMNLQDEE